MEGWREIDGRCNLALLESPAPCGRGITDSHSRAVDPLAAVWTTPLNKPPLSTLGFFGQVGK